MREGTTNYVSEDGGNGEEDAVSSVIGVILMVSITVIIAATVGTLVINSALVGEGVEEPTNGGVTFNYDYEADSELMKVTVTYPGNIERLYIGRRSGSFDDGDIVSATGGWLNETARRDSAGRIVDDGNKVVNKDVRAADTLILSNVTAEDKLVLTADKGRGTKTTLVSNWEADDWTYRGD